ncbi:hypothetical protein CO2235_160051 [Cupriavidus oxalaticus]|uniref:Uncharacterized protein n=1 Tax=Cupriavidus oxalaticus TaxID=96344 RepID=A0A375G481_9BURK|nr:hypothetical protein CO2235_160051 [Cupriavidus oxalaticus]
MIALLGRGAPGGAAADQALHLAACLEQAQLLADIDRRDQQAALRQHHDQVLPRQPLDRFANGGAPDAGHFAQLQFRYRTARRQLQCHDRFLDLPVGQVGQLAALAGGLFRLWYSRGTWAGGSFCVHGQVSKNTESYTESPLYMSRTHLLYTSDLALAHTLFSATIRLIY